MQLRRFRAGVRRGRTATHALIALSLAAVLAVLAVSADAGTAGSKFAAVQRAPAAPIGARNLGAPASGSAQTGYVVLKPRDEQALKSFIASVTRPHSKDYHQYLRPGQFAGRFGPTSSTIAAVKSQLSRDGLSVTSASRDGLLIGFSGTTARVESAFNTGLERYRSAAGITGEQTTRAISLPSSISADVSAVIGLNTLVHPQADLVRPPRSAYASHPAAKTARFTHYPGAPNACANASSTASLFGGLTDDQIANAYGATPLYGAGDTGAGVNIGVYELEPFSRSDLRTFDECYFGTTQGDAMASSVSTVNVDGGQPAGSGSGESILDIEDVSAMAPGAHIDVYQAPNSTAGALDEYAQMVNDDKDQIISSSWGLCEQDLQLADPGAQQAENYIFQQAAAQGQTVLNAAGDTGSDTCNEVHSVPPPTDQNPLSVGDPASQPYVLAVGGTTIQNADPSNYDASSETVWNDGAQWGGGGGGISMSWEAPPWQQAAAGFPMPGSSDYTAAESVENSAASSGISSQNLTPTFCAANTTAGFTTSTPCRTLPDVSAQADEFTGAVTIYSASFAIPGVPNSSWITIGGTSSATPIWAGMLALVDASSVCTAAGTKVGFASPLLYAVAANANQYGASFHDITVGNNDVFGFANGKVFPATTGYDLASGLGSPILADGPTPATSSTPGLALNLCNLAAGSTGRPAVTGLSSKVGPVAGGGTLTVTGTGFMPTGVTVRSVSIGADVIPGGSLSSVTNTSLTFTLPAAKATLAPGDTSSTDLNTGTTYTSGGSTSGQDGAGLANIVVTLSNGISSQVYPNNSTNQDQYTYVDQQSGAAAPSVSSVSPYAGVNTGGTQITIYGSGFDGLGTSTADTVTVGGVAATSVDAVSPWEIRATTPNHSSSAGNATCLTEGALETELGTAAVQAQTNICQTEVVVTDGSGHSSATTKPLPTYLGPLPSTSEDGLLEVPSNYELSPVPDEYDYVPAPTITSVTPLSTGDGLANADPGTYGTPTFTRIDGTGLNYQTLNWMSFGDPTQASSQDISAPAYADGTKLVLAAPADPNGPGLDPDQVPVTADSMGGQSSCATTCLAGNYLSYAGIPTISGVAVPPYNAASDISGTPVTITGTGLGDVTGPLEFVDAGPYPLSTATQYQYSHVGDTEIDTKTVQQNPAVVDTQVCSDSGCATTAGTAGEQLLLYPPGNPVITSIQTSSGPPAGGTLVTINGENLGCVTSISFGSDQVLAASNTQALLDCGSTSQILAVAPPGAPGSSVPITIYTAESVLAPGGAPATSPTDFTYDTVNPSVTASVAFGSINLASSSTRTVTITNPSAATQPLYVEPLGVPDANGNQFPVAASIGEPNAGDFAIVGDSCSDQTLAPGASCAMQVQFAPSGLGARTATLDIPWNDSLSVLENAGFGSQYSQTPDFSVPLSGTGAEPTITVTTPGATVTVTKKITCKITVTWRWVTVKIHGHKRRRHKKFIHRSAGCKLLAKRAGAHHRRHRHHRRG